VLFLCRAACFFFFLSFFVVHCRKRMRYGCCGDAIVAPSAAPEGFEQQTGGRFHGGFFYAPSSSFSTRLCFYSSVFSRTDQRWSGYVGGWLEGLPHDRTL
jgi:hypothetical protein